MFLHKSWWKRGKCGLLVSTCGLFNSPKEGWLMSAPKRTQGWREWMSAIQVSACPTDSCLHLSVTELDCIIHEKCPLKEHLSSQSLKTNKRHTHTLPPPPPSTRPFFAYQSEQTVCNLSAITAPFCPSRHHSPLTPNWGTHTVCFPSLSSHQFPSLYLSSTSFITASPAAHWQLHKY